MTYKKSVMMTVDIDEGTYELALKMAERMHESLEYVLYRSVLREYVDGYDTFYSDQLETSW